jgi:hypothetical protein
MNRTYFSAIFFATVAMALSFYAGTLYQIAVTPRPCISNLSERLHILNSQMQSMLDNNNEYNPNSEFYQSGITSPRELAHHLVEMSQSSAFPSSIFVNDQGQEFYVPSFCRIDSVTALGNPILVRN